VVSCISRSRAGGKRYSYKRGSIPNRLGIEHRTAEADLKQEPGHYGIDTIFSKYQQSFSCDFKTLTADNFSEFAQDEQITEITGAAVYFARFYHS
jgi:transposase, IS30 family